MRDDPYRYPSYSYSHTGTRNGIMLDGHGHIEEDELLSSEDEQEKYTDYAEGAIGESEQFQEQEASTARAPTPAPASTVSSHLKRKRRNLTPEFLRAPTVIIQETDSVDDDDNDAGEDDEKDGKGEVVADFGKWRVQQNSSSCDKENDESSGDEEILEFGGGLSETAPSTHSRPANVIADVEDSLLSNMSFLQHLDDPGFSLFGATVGDRLTSPR